MGDYDNMGNVTQRQDNNRGLTENFYYDTDYRLDHSTLNSVANLQMTYDGGQPGPGNITARSDVAGGYAYTYDGNGNATSRNGYTCSWTSYNYPSGVNSSGESATFLYGPDRQRWKTVYTGSIGTETTYHIGKLLEKVANNSLLDYRHYIYAGTELVGIYSRQSTGTNTMRYVLGDHQTGFAGIVSSTGTTDVSESFTAFGTRRNGETWSGPPTDGDENSINGVSRQGYTGQTALGLSMGLNHMNGRIEDSITGRFLSPDPYIPIVGNTQSFNRYSYVDNNPLSYADPSGFDPCNQGTDNPGNCIPEIVVTGSVPASTTTIISPGGYSVTAPDGGLTLVGIAPKTPAKPKNPSAPIPVTTIPQPLPFYPSLGGGPMRPVVTAPAQRQTPLPLPTPKNSCMNAGANTVFTGGGVGSLVIGTAGLVNNASHAIVELPDALTTASELGGFDGIIYGAAAFTEVAEFGAVGLLVGGTAGFVAGAAIVGTGVYVYDVYQNHSGACSP